MKTILLVADDLNQSVLLSEALREHDLELERVSTLFDGLEALTTSSSDFDVLVIDLSLPDSDGLATLQAALHESTVPVVVCGATDDPEVARRARLMGAAGLIGKDEPISAVVEVVRKALSDSLHEPAARTAPRVLPENSESDTLSRQIAQTLDFLNRSIPLGSWLFTRVIDDDWIVLDAVGDAYGIEPGAVFAWSDSYCRRMVDGDGPQLTVSPSDVPAYRDAGINQTLAIGAYTGKPVTVAGNLFGTLCGIDPEKQGDDFVHQESLVEFAAQVLSDAVAADLDRDRLLRRLELAQLASRTDHLTALNNRRAFDRMLSVEEARSRRYGHSVSVMMIDLDGLKHINDTDGHAAGDSLLRGLADVLTQTTRASDMVFRIGGDEFALIASPSSFQAETWMTSRLQTALDQAGISASIGVATSSPRESLATTVERADKRMFEAKASTRGASMDEGSEDPG